MRRTSRRTRGRRPGRVPDRPRSEGAGSAMARRRAQPRVPRPGPAPPAPNILRRRSGTSPLHRPGRAAPAPFRRPRSSWGDRSSGSDRLPRRRTRQRPPPSRSRRAPRPRGAGDGVLGSTLLLSLLIGSAIAATINTLNSWVTLPSFLLRAPPSPRALIGVRCKEKGTDETCKKRDGTDEQRETYRAFPLPPATAQRAVTNHCPKGNKGYHREKERENGAHASVPWTVAAGALSLRTTCERSDASHGSAPAAAPEWSVAEVSRDRAPPHQLAVQASHRPREAASEPRTLVREQECRAQRLVSQAEAGSRHHKSPPSPPA